MNDCCAPRNGNGYNLAIIGACSAGFSAAIIVSGRHASWDISGRATIMNRGPSSLGGSARSRLRSCFSGLCQATSLRTWE